MATQEKKKPKEFDDNLIIQRKYQESIREGRVDGKFKCPVCGSRYNDQCSAVMCCKINDG